MARKNRRLNLQVPKSLVDWFNWYCRVTNIKNQIMTIESEEIKGKANLLRFFISRYDTYLRFHYPPNEPLPSQQPIAWEEPDKNLPIYLTPRDELVWEKLIREGYVNNYSQLGTRALQHAQKLTETRVKRAKNRFQEWQQLNSLHSLFEEINHA